MNTQLHLSSLMLLGVIINCLSVSTAAAEELRPFRLGTHSIGSNSITFVLHEQYPSLHYDLNKWRPQPRKFEAVRVRFYRKDKTRIGRLTSMCSGGSTPHLGAGIAGPLTKELISEAQYFSIETIDCRLLNEVKTQGVQLKHLDYLRTLLKSPEPEDRLFAAANIAKLGKSASPAIPELLKALDDDDALVVRYSAGVLGRIGEKKAIPKFIQLLSDSEKWSAAAWGLKFFGPDARQAVPHLLQAKDRVDSEFHNYIDEVVEAIK